MLRAFIRAIDYSREHPKEAYTIMAEREGLSLEDFQAAIEQDLHILGPQEQAQFYGRISACSKHCKALRRYCWTVAL